MMNENGNLRFSIRKLTIGVVSVMFGVILFGISVHPVHADEMKSNTTQALVQKKQAAPVAGENYNAQVQKTAPAIVVKPDTDQSEVAVTNKFKNGLESVTAISAKNKNTNQETVAKAANQNQVIYNSSVATDGKFTITISNPTTTTKNVDDDSYSNFFNLPAWNGTHANIVVDGSRINVDKAGNPIFGGSYRNLGLTIDNFDLADSLEGSTGCSRTGQEAMKDPSKIGGFEVNGNLAAGKVATIIIPIKVKDASLAEIPGNFGNFGSLYGKSMQVRTNQVISDLSNQNGKDYFLVDQVNEKDGQFAFHSVSQEVINDLIAKGIYPTYQDGDVSLNDFDFGLNTDSAQTKIINAGYVDIQKAEDRLNKVLNPYGYKIVRIGEDLGFGSVKQDGYVNFPSYQYYDAQGKLVKLGTGNLSNFMLALVRQKKVELPDKTVAPNSPNPENQLVPNTPTLVPAASSVSSDTKKQVPKAATTVAPKPEKTPVNKANSKVAKNKADSRIAKNVKTRKTVKITKMKPAKKAAAVNIKAANKQKKHALSSTIKVAAQKQQKALPKTGVKKSASAAAGLLLAVLGLLTMNIKPVKQRK